MRASDTPVAVHVLRATIRFVEDDEGKKQVVPPNKAHGTCGAQVCIMISREIFPVRVRSARFASTWKQSCYLLRKGS